jgi:hypothetical protein
MIDSTCDDSFVIQWQWLIPNCSSMNCFDVVPVDATVMTTSSELFLPARSLQLGLYELKLTVTMNDVSNSALSYSVHVRIVWSGIAANLVELETSMISSGVEEDVHLNPGLHSFDLDGDPFNATVNHSLFSSVTIQMSISGLDLRVSLSRL